MFIGVVIMDKKIIYGLIIGIIILSGCAQNNYDNTVTPQEDKNYFVSLAPSQSGKQVNIKGETNLPDGSIIGITMVKDLNNGHVNIIAQDSVTVSGGKFSSILGPFVKYVETGKYEVSATFTPMAQKSQNVLNEIGGKQAPKLIGKDVEMSEFGFNVLSVETNMNWVNNKVKDELNEHIKEQETVDTWCRDGCKLMANSEGWSTSEYDDCVSACLEG